MKITAKTEILRVLTSVAPKALAVHELGIVGYSENCLATRLSELASVGLVVGARRPDKSFKEWALAKTTA